MSAAVMVGCGQPRPEPEADVGGPLLRGDQCADYTGGGGASLSGTLHGQRDRARRVAARLRGLDDLGANHTEPGGNTVRLIPICENHRLRDNQLQRGRFVAALTGPGTAPRFSSMPNDTVLWWVYGERMQTGAGADTLVWHSEFLSMGSDAAASYLVATHMEICDGTPPEDREAVSWHADSCHVDEDGRVMLLSGSRPWFGCTRGCCYGALPTL
jgi:hypothetical protein